ncbi:MAG: hypothetical protein H7343_17910 [Undibacterium sp.]|nr:hypothetical protein [Opitutaceae bacterium]
MGGKSARRLKTEAFGTAALRDARAADIRANIAEGVPASRLPKAVASTSEDISDFTAAFASMPKKAVVSMKKIPSYCAQLKEDFASLFVRR